MPLSIYPLHLILSFVTRLFQRFLVPDELDRPRTERLGRHLQGSLAKKEHAKEKQRQARHRCGLISKKPVEKDEVARGTRHDGRPRGWSKRSRACSRIKMASQYRNKRASCLSFSLPLFLFIYFVRSSLTHTRVDEATLVAYIYIIYAASSTFDASLFRVDTDLFGISAKISFSRTHLCLKNFEKSNDSHQASLQVFALWNSKSILTKGLNPASLRQILKVSISTFNFKIIYDCRIGVFDCRFL